MTSLSLEPYYSDAGLYGTCSAVYDCISAQHHDLISFLALMQHCGVDFLPIKWQPALEDLGRGASADVSQALINSQMSFAFKRVSFVGRSTEECFRKLTTEVLVLRNRLVQGHPNIIRLEAYCCEILAGYGRLSPVLIFEKAHLGNLQSFILSEKATEVPFDVKVSLCSDIAGALHVLHSNHIVHGDIKPLNVLVYRYDKKLIAKLADFGDSSIGVGGLSIVTMPKSRPWFAPEYHGRGSSVRQAQMMETYSFGLVCYWLLLGNHFQYDGQGATTGLHPSIAMLEKLKQTNTLHVVAREILFTAEDLSLEQKNNLLLLFDRTLADNPEDRMFFPPAVNALLGKSTGRTTNLMSINPDNLQLIDLHPKLRLVEYMVALGHADRRIRLSITKELESRYWNNGCALCKANDAFQVALCLRTGFALSYNLEESNVWLERSGHTTQDLMSEIDHGRGSNLHVYKEERIRNLQEEYLTTVYYAHEYKKEIKAVGDLFGHTHELTIILTRIHATLLWEEGLYEEAADQQKRLLTLLSMDGQRVPRLKVLSDLSMTYSAQGQYREAQKIREETVEELNQTFGPEHIFTLTAMNNLAKTHLNMRDWKQAEDLLLQVIAKERLKLGDEHSHTLSAKCNLAAVYYMQSRWDEAEILQSEVLEAKKGALGDSHESTLYSMVSLAAIKGKKGNADDSQALETKVVDLRKNLLGPRHPDTLIAMSNLALTYGQKEQWSREEEILTQVREGRTETLGAHHRDTIATLAELARNYRSQGRLDGAEALQVEVLHSRSRTLGEKDYYTLASRTNLAWVFVDQRKWPQAEALQRQTIILAEEGHGKSDPVVLRCMSSLASMYKVHNRLEESLSLYTKVLEARSESLDERHPDRLKSGRDVETVKNMLATQRLQCQG